MPSSSYPSRAAMQSEVRRLLPILSSSQTNVLDELVFAIHMVDGCGMTLICNYLSELLDQAMNTLRQKYRETSDGKKPKLSSNRAVASVVKWWGGATADLLWRAPGLARTQNTGAGPG